MGRCVSAVAVACLVLPVAGHAVDNGAPPAERGPVVTTYHGVKVADPYRWLENPADPKTVAWDKAENDRTRAYLDALPVRAAIEKRMTKLVGESSPAWRNVRRAGGHVFALVTAPPRQQPMVDVLGGAAGGVPTAVGSRAVVDPNTLDPSGQTAIDWFVPSPDGKLVAVSLSKNGSEDGTVHVFDVDSGHETGDVVPAAQFPTAGGSLAWKADGSGFWVTRYPGTERPEADRHFFQTVWFHKLGTPTASDSYVIGRDFPKVGEISLDNAEDPDVLMVTVENGDGGQFQHVAIGADGAAHAIDAFGDGIVDASVGPDGTTYLVSRKGTPRGALLAMAPGVFTLAQAKTLVPEGDAAIESAGEFGTEGSPVVATHDRLYLRELIGGPSRIAMYGLAGKPLGQLPIDGLGAVDEVDPVGVDSVIYSVSSYVRPPRFLSWDAVKQTGGETTLRETSPIRFDDCTVTRVFATSKDGTKIPVNIIARKGTKLDGRNPAMLYGYGGYGVSMVPEFLGAPVRVFLDGGGVYAIANIRGGGEYGEAWHQQGALTKKQNVFDDFHAASRLLIDQRYTSPARFAILGGSNGGLLMGAALTQWPQDYRAVASLVGIYDMMRIELDPNGAFNVTEFGTVKDPADFRAMLAYSPYQHVRTGTAYPAVFMATGTHDGRVNPAESRKMVAALQNATSSGLSVYLSISDKAGHGIGSSNSVRIAQRSDWLAFTFDQLGMTLPETVH